jgi:hypothetical protein
VELWRSLELRVQVDAEGGGEGSCLPFTRWAARRPQLRPTALAVQMAGGLVAGPAGGQERSAATAFQTELFPCLPALGRELRSIEVDLASGAFSVINWAVVLPAVRRLLVRCAFVCLGDTGILAELHVDASGGSVMLQPGCIPPGARLCELRLARCTLLAGLPPSLAAATALTALHLEAVTAHSSLNWAEAVAPLWTMTQLRRLHYPRTGDAAASPGLSCLTVLTRLTLRADPAVDEQGPDFTAFSSLQQLRVLDLAACMVREVSILHFGSIHGVEQLVLSRNPGLRFGGICAAAFVFGVTYFSPEGRGPAALRTLELDVGATRGTHVQLQLIGGFECFITLSLVAHHIRALRFTAGAGPPAPVAGDDGALASLLRHMRDHIGPQFPTLMPCPPAARLDLRLVHFDEGAIEAAGGLGTKAARELVELAKIPGMRVVVGAAGAEEEMPWVRQL